MGYSKDTNTEFAIKIVKDNENNEFNYKATMNENVTLLQLRHPNIVKLYNIRVNGHYEKSNGKVKDDVTYAVLELARNGEIFEYLVTTGRFSEPLTRYYFLQFISAINHCHENGFAHRDLKPENLLLDGDFNLKVADFGFATTLCGKYGNGRLHTCLGTSGYMAPEILQKGTEYNGRQVDIFSMGVILFIFMTGIPPFKTSKINDALYHLIITNKHSKFWNWHSARKNMTFSENFKSLFNSMVAFEASHRPTISEICTHPWFSELSATHEEVVKEMTARKFMIDAITLQGKKEVSQNSDQIEEKKINSELQENSSSNNSLNEIQINSLNPENGKSGNISRN